MDSIPPVVWIIALITMSIIGWGTARFFANRGLSGALGFWLGFFLGVFPVIIVMAFGLGSDLRRQ